MTERLHFHFSLSCIREGNGNPLQYSCLENPRDGGAWWAAIYGVAQDRTRLKRFGGSSSMSIELVMPSNHLILCHPLLLLPSSFPSIRAFSNESVLHIRWPKYFTLIDNPHIGFSLRLCLALEPELSMRNCCHLVATSSRTTLKPVLKEFYYSKGLCVQLFVTPWTVAHQALLSMGFPRQEYWSGLPFPSPW